MTRTIVMNDSLPLVWIIPGLVKVDILPKDFTLRDSSSHPRPPSHIPSFPTTQWKGPRIRRQEGHRSLTITTLAPPHLVPEPRILDRCFPATEVDPCSPAAVHRTDDDPR